MNRYDDAPVLTAYLATMCLRRLLSDSPLVLQVNGAFWPLGQAERKDARAVFARNRYPGG